MAPTREGFTFVGFQFTQNAWTVPAAAIDRFKVTVAGLLEDGQPGMLLCKSDQERPTTKITKITKITKWYGAGTGPSFVNSVIVVVPHLLL